MRVKFLIKELEKTKGSRLSFFPPIQLESCSLQEALPHHPATLISSPKNSCSPCWRWFSLIVPVCSLGVIAPLICLHAQSYLSEEWLREPCDMSGSFGRLYTMCPVITWFHHWGIRMLPSHTPFFSLIRINAKEKIKISHDPFTHR